MSTTGSRPQSALHPADAAVGPFYDRGGVARWRGVSLRTIAEQVNAGELIALTAEGREIYPTWQFDTSARAYPPLVAAWNVLREQADPWTAAIWLHTPQSAFDGVDAAAWIAHGGDREVLAKAAAADAARWAA